MRKAFFRVADLDAVREAVGAEHKKSWVKGKHYGVELHLSNSYYAVTGQEYGSGLVGDYLRLVPLDDLLWLVEQAERFKGKRKASGGESTGRPFRVVRDALMSIPNDGSIADNDSRDWWLEIGMALHHASGGSGEGAEAWHEWSARWHGYDEEATAAAWESFRRSTGRVRTGQHILNIAEGFGWRDLERMFGLFTDDMVDVPFGSYLRDEDGVRDRAGLPDVTPHVLKHTAITWAMQKGLTVEDAADYFDTSAETIRKVYYHHSPHYMDRALDILERKL